jgi:hypothetical protein
MSLLWEPARDRCASHSERSGESRYGLNETLRYARGDIRRRSPRRAKGDRPEGIVQRVLMGQIG